jgi:Flp pilus assembly protein TadB
MTRFYKNIFILAACVMLSAQVFPQQGKSSAAAKKNEKVQEENKKAYEKARKKTIKHRREIQTKETRERMDGVDRKAKAYNSRNDRKWYQDIFKKKKSRR